MNQGAVFLDSAATSPRLGFASARCAGGTLFVDEAEKAPRDLMSRILDHVLGEGNLHPIEYQLYWANLRENAMERVRAAMPAPALEGPSPALRENDPAAEGPAG